jgi:hypothetical protein
MHEIEKYISPFIESQFPLFYQEEGPIFIDFVKAYYEWMELQGNEINNDIKEKGIIYEARSLLEYRDIDNTTELFIKYFKDKYISSLPENVIADKKLLTKHILDLYRSKGTENSYKLLFRMIFNEDIEVYLPGKDVFKTSDGEWSVQRYIEVTDSPYLADLIGKQIYSNFTKSRAVVSDYYTKTVNGKLLNILIIEDLLGRFKYGEKIFCDDIPEITFDSAPFVFGSLSSISITNGGIDYNVGDILNVNKSGVGALARVKAVKSKNGEVTFKLLSGGTGFSMNAVINVDGSAFPILNTTNTNPVIVETKVAHGLNSGQSVRIDFVEGAVDLNTSLYEYYANTVNSTAFEIYTDPFLSAPLDGTSFNSYVKNSGFIYINTGGAGAMFEVGSLTNKQIYKINTDVIDDYYFTLIDSKVSGIDLGVTDVNGIFSVGDDIVMDNIEIREFDVENISPHTLLVGETLSNNYYFITDLQTAFVDDSLIILKGSDINNSNLVYGVELTGNISGAVLKINNALPSYTLNASANVKFVDPSYLTVNNQIGYFLLGEMIYDTTSGANAIITSIDRLTDWSFPKVSIPDIDNLDKNIDEVLTNVNLEVGTIASLKNINPGQGYALDPVVSVVEPLIYEYKIIENDGSIKGFNSRITAKAGYSNGIVTAVEIVDSGFGYEKDTDVDLVSNTNPYSVSGKTVIDLSGVSAGYWKDNKSFISDKKYLQDSNYFQNYSYEIVASRMLNTYENYVKDLVHPTGMKLFGRYSIRNEFSETGALSESSFTSS